MYRLCVFEIDVNCFTKKSEAMFIFLTSDIRQNFQGEKRKGQSVLLRGSTAGQNNQVHLHEIQV